MATDVEFIERVKRVTDPLEMLELIVKNESFLGYDPYYRDIRNVLINTAESIVKAYAQEPPTEGWDKERAET